MRVKTKYNEFIGGKIGYPLKLPWNVIDEETGKFPMCQTNFSREEHQIINNLYETQGVVSTSNIVVRKHYKLIRP